MNALMICGICVISVGMEGKAGIYFPADLADFLFRYYHRGAFSTISSKRLIFRLDTVMPKEKVNYQEVYDLYQLCSETKDLKEFCSEYGINYDKFMNWQRHQLWDEMWRGGK